MINEPKSSLLARRTALAGLALALLALLLGWLRVLPPLAAFAAIMLCLMLAATVALIAAFIGIARGGWRHRPAWLALGLALVPAIVVFVFVASAGRVPPIHDVTTSPDDPPAFSAVAALTENSDRDLAYPHGDEGSTQLQREAYPDLTPILYAKPPAAAFEDVVATVRDLGWRIIAVEPERGLLEASDETSWLHFVDDVVIRVRPAPEGSRIDVRSTSRQGQSDLGMNAKRIRHFRERLRSR